MMINNMKAYELNELEMNEVAGGYDAADVKKAVDGLDPYRRTDLDEKVCEAAKTAWEVVKYAFELCG